MTDTLWSRLNQVCDRLDTAASRYGVDPVALMVAVKHRDAQTCVAVGNCLARAHRPVLLGHNHVQQARDTAAYIRQHLPQARIHLIGHLQTNKINAAVGAVDAIDTIDSVRLVDKLSQRLEPQRILDVFIQVNTSGETTKSGCSLDEARKLADLIGESKQLRLRGLMTIGAHTTDSVLVHRSFAALATLRQQLQVNHHDCVELSMGMSADCEAAIAEGATIVRIGQAILGPR